MSRFSNLALQVITVAILGYLLRWALYGRSDIPFFAWIVICLAAVALGLSPYLFVGSTEESEL